ncbi:transmembrane transporter [Malassezia pachydermatis]|uniref:Peptide transporter ptr2a n=1 Tax=Malassezia pachydermatis TaxID=77020 RepID=A0A0M8MXF1_9BASI|nr:peptide transporter ptr2a [Malassezia pachydermatis]KOS16274.1 peptide transporter ptr2a [Malassezia pachydermatis]
MTNVHLVSPPTYGNDYEQQHHEHHHGAHPLHEYDLPAEPAPYQGAVAAVGMVGQEDYNMELEQTGHKPEIFPAGVAHLTDAEKLDETIDEWHFPTEEERMTLRRVPEKMNWPAFAICVCEFAERFSYYGATQVYSNFINNPRPTIGGNFSETGANHGSGEAKSGALGLGSVTAQGLILFNSFWCYVTPLIAAWIADAYLGRFRIICYGVVIAQVGHILLVISAIPGVLNNQTGAEACFVLALIIMGTGTGIFKSSCPVLVAEQIKIKEQTVVTLKSGEKVIVDPALTTARTYMWYYEMINLGSLAGQLGMIYAERNVGFWLAFLLPTLVFFLPFPVLWFGRNYYKSEPPNGSVLTQACGALWIGIKKTASWNPIKMVRSYGSKEFWDYARPSNYPDPKPKWMTYEDRWIDQLARGIKACNIFVLFPLYWLCYNQINSPLIVQAGQMDMGGSPNELVAQLDPIFIIVFVLLFQFGLYPMAEKYSIPFTPIRRITIGFILASFSMIWAAVVQHYIYKTSPCHDHVGDEGYFAPDGSECSELDKNRSPLNMWVTAGAFVLIAFSELFASVTSMEVAMVMAPKNMRSIVMAIGSFTSAVASAIGEAFVPLAENPLWVVNYGVFAGLAFVGGILFYICFRNVDRHQDELNLIGQEGFENEVAYAEGHPGEPKPVTGNAYPSEKTATQA